MQIVNADIEGDPLPRFLDDRIHLRPHLLDDLLDPAGMDSAVGDQPLQGEARHLAPHRIEAGEHDRLRRIIDDQIDPRRRLDRPDIPPLPADDPPLHLIVGKVDHRYRVFGHIITRIALNRIGDDLPRRLVGRPPGLLLDLPDHQGGIPFRRRFHRLDEKVLCLLRGNAGDLFQLLLLLFQHPVGTFMFFVELGFPLQNRLFPVFDGVLLLRQKIDPPIEILFLGPESSFQGVEFPFLSRVSFSNSVLTLSRFSLA